VIDLVGERLAGAVGAPHVSVEGRRATVRPGSTTEVADLLRVAREVSVTIGVGASSGATIALDLGRMCNVLEIDETSLLVTAQAGLAAEQLEAQIATRGLSLGPLPFTSAERTLGALAAAPRPSEASPQRGRLVGQITSLSALLADGTEIATRSAPRKAVGPDLMHALIGARGATGIITSVTLRVHRRGEARREAAFRFEKVQPALATARALLVRGARPYDLHVSGDGLLVLTTDGTEPCAEAEVKLAERIARERGGTPTPHAPLLVLKRAPHERFAPMDRLDLLEPPPHGRVSGWHALGATVLDPDRAPDPLPPHPLLAELREKLDPDRRFSGSP
jgi:FAD/FMN-containing dehydrogenase